MVIGYWLMVIGYWLMVIGYWLLVKRFRGAEGIKTSCEAPSDALKAQNKLAHGRPATSGTSK